VFLGPPVLGRVTAATKEEMRPKYLRRTLIVHARPGISVKRRTGVGAP
jgi:hypothetical protein